MILSFLSVVATVMGSVVRVSFVVVVVAIVVTGVMASQQGPLTCWSCSANTHGQDCYDLDLENKTLAKTCSPEEPFCTVNRIWYVVEAGAEPRNFSVNRTCALACTPSCVVIGDRTKIHSCASCCTTSYCNIVNSASARPLASIPLAVAAPLLGGCMVLLSPLMHSLPAG
ncbi:hypothetical protein GWK47_023084 [Chionoecetes opilio]|uniref:Uncharacterized protein n=1 Tax=Chionoecetes opilio TaxID=41210 RepID=A0A8J4XM85_CHIOP|nr:hypothetical protein GWK47_023084 [Chionoecetes opilio]